MLKHLEQYILAFREYLSDLGVIPVDLDQFMSFLIIIKVLLLLGELSLHINLPHQQEHRGALFLDFLLRVLDHFWNILF